MANLQVKNVPEPTHKKIRRFAQRQGRTVREVVLDAILQKIEREEFLEKLATRAPVKLGRSAARTLKELRDERDTEL